MYIYIALPTVCVCDAPRACELAISVIFKKITLAILPYLSPFDTSHVTLFFLERVLNQEYYSLSVSKY